ncbi:hypothetical protein FJZ48_02735 [Candidatus Uhrbacteria bacterium]|nr:hypothetical protein [Candidatus Uhrbacteria bacterium]
MKSPFESMKRAVKKVAMGATLLASVGAASEAAAKKPERKPTLTNKAENKLETTQASAWAEEIFTRAKNDINKLRTSEDAEAWMRKFASEFEREWRFPSKGPMVEIAPKVSPGVKDHAYQKDDRQQVKKKASELKRLMDRVHDQFPESTPTWEEAGASLDRLTAALAVDSSYAAQADRDEIDRLLQELKK